jgi:hypothetical protein
MVTYDIVSDTRSAIACQILGLGIQNFGTCDVGQCLRHALCHGLSNFRARDSEFWNL